MKNSILDSKYLTFLTMGYVASIICSLILFTKQVQIGDYALNGGTIAYPITYLIAALIVEIYGYKQSRKANWSATILANSFALMTSIIIRLPSPTGYADNTNNLLIVLGYDWRFAFAGSVAFIITSFMMAYLISRWKVLLKGKNYFLRFIGSVIIAEFFDTIIVFSIALIGVMSVNKIIELIIIAYLFKIISSFILAYPATILANAIKKAEGIDIFDEKIDYNPFKIS